MKLKTLLKARNCKTTADLAEEFEELDGIRDRLKKEVEELRAYKRMYEMRTKQCEMFRQNIVNERCAFARIIARVSNGEVDLSGDRMPTIQSLERTIRKLAPKRDEELRTERWVELSNWDLQPDDPAIDFSLAVD